MADDILAGLPRDQGGEERRGNKKAKETRGGAEAQKDPENGRRQRRSSQWTDLSGEGVEDKEEKTKEKDEEEEKPSRLS